MQVLRVVGRVSGDCLIRPPGTAASWIRMVTDEVVESDLSGVCCWTGSGIRGN